MARLSIAATTCGKCDGGGPAVAASGGAGMCRECFRAHLFGKFKLAVTSNAMVRPTDAVLLAFSGGPASRSPILSYSPSSSLLCLLSTW
jgi:cytoplasmic tRNA 2-thiolation protein 2